MTACLTDAPEFLLEFGVHAEPRSRNSLAAGEQKLWHLLGGGDEVWVGTLELASEFWRRVVVIREAPGSQLDVLHRHLGRDLPLDGPVACLALGGRHFHGQRGRPWQARPGNVHLSVAVAPRLELSRLGVGLILLPAVAAVDAVRHATRGQVVPDLKWVNDVLVGGRKMGGVLTTTLCQWQTVEVAVMGVGLNVGVVPDVTPTPFVPAAGCIHDLAGAEHVSVAGLLAPLLNGVGHRYETLCRDGPAALFEAYRDRSIVLGRSVRIWEQGLDHTTPQADWPLPFAVGVVEDLAPDLSLGLVGHEERIHRGRLAFEEICREFGL